MGKPHLTGTCALIATVPPALLATTDCSDADAAFTQAAFDALGAESALRKLCKSENVSARD